MEANKNKYSRSQFKSGERKTAKREERSNYGIAVLRNCRMSPRKVRQVADLVRGQGVDQALELVSVLPKKAALHIGRTLKSAVANYRNRDGNEHVEESNLRVATAFVDGGFSMKRIKFRAQGRAAYIKKRTSHLTIYVASNE
ncbi:MAG: 50S ribosomal protein L22 [Calditrichaeota bacterium]|nr:MAG: 50S ribosomal protein L22 [Calditrichota bacterium]